MGKKRKEHSRKEKKTEKDRYKEEPVSFRDRSCVWFGDKREQNCTVYMNCQYRLCPHRCVEV